MIRINSAGDSIYRPDHWRNRWTRFLSEHGNWWSRRTVTNDAVYAIPKSVIGELCNLGPSGVRRHNGRRFFTKLDEQSERAFTDLCKAQNQCVVGVTGTSDIIHYQLLSQEAAVWQPDANRNSDVFDRIVAEGRNRHLAITQSQSIHAALLIQQPQYWQELLAIRSKWQALQGDLELAFDSVNGRSVPIDAWVTEAQLEQSQTPAESELRMALWYFTRKWDVAAFLTWELPIPKRPVSHPPLASCDSLRLVEQPSFSTPSYLTWSRLFGDGKPVWKRGRSSPITEGLGTETSGDRFVRKHSNLLHLYLSEVAVRSRFSGSFPSGAVTCFQNGMERELDISSDHVKRFRKCYRAALVNDS